MLRNLVICGTLVSALFAFTYGHNRAVPMIPLTIEPASFDKAHEGIFVTTTPYNSSESVHYLNHDLIGHGYQPVQITIQNNSAQTYYIHPNEMSLPTDHEGQVSNQYLINSIPRSIVFKVLGFIFWPLMIPGTVDSIRTYVKHREIQNDLFAKTLKEEHIPPYSSFLRVAYVPLKHYHPDFTISLINAQTSERVEFSSNLLAEETLDA